jgi:hypothetical protein
MPGIYVPPKFNPGADPLLSGVDLYKPRSYGLSIDPLLSVSSIMDKFTAANNFDTGAYAKSLVEPSLELVRRDVGNQVAQMRADAISDSVKRGIVGGSTLEGKLTTEIPAYAATALSDAETKLITQALPVAQQEKQLGIQGVGQLASLRSMISGEQFNSMSLEQKDQLAASDQRLQVQLKEIDQQFQQKIQEAQFAFQRAENERDRQIADAQYQQLLAERRKAREGAFLSGITSLIGMGVGYGIGGPTGSLVGLGAGKQTGDMLGFLMS